MKNILTRAINWPVGFGNRIALGTGLILFLISFTGMVGQLLFQSQLNFKAPLGYELAMKIISLVFTVALLALRPLRQKLPLVLSGLAVLALMGVLGKVIAFMPEGIAPFCAILYSLLGCVATGLFCLGLLQGEKLL